MPFGDDGWALWLGEVTVSCPLLTPSQFIPHSWDMTELYRNSAAYIVTTSRFACSKRAKVQPFVVEVDNGMAYILCFYSLLFSLHRCMVGLELESFSSVNRFRIGWFTGTKNETSHSFILLSHSRNLMLQPTVWQVPALLLSSCWATDLSLGQLLLWPAASDGFHFWWLNWVESCWLQI